MITREKFVEICNECIKKTREELTIVNQVSGYLKYHNEVKNNYMEYFRDVSIRNSMDNGYSLNDLYEMIRRSKVGQCEELAYFLCVKIIMRLQEEQQHALIKIVSSTKVDHAFLHITISLDGEKHKSKWEVDAWDPRIIDITRRPDGSIKNRRKLSYGAHPNTVDKVKVKEFRKKLMNRDYFFALRKPVEGPAPGSVTPEREAAKKHKWLYSNYTLEKAYKKKRLDEKGEIHYLQRKSSWQ